MEQKFQSENQLLALKIHGLLTQIWEFVSFPVVWVLSSVDSTLTDPNES